MRSRTAEAGVEFEAACDLPYTGTPGRGMWSRGMVITFLQTIVFTFPRQLSRPSRNEALVVSSQRDRCNEIFELTNGFPATADLKGGGSFQDRFSHRIQIHQVKKQYVFDRWSCPFVIDTGTGVSSQCAHRATLEVPMKTPAQLVNATAPAMNPLPAHLGGAVLSCRRLASALALCRRRERFDTINRGD